MNKNCILKKNKKKNPVTLFNQSKLEKMSADMDIAEEGKLRQLARDAADTRGPEDSMDDLLNWNNLTYTMPVTNSVVTTRNLKAYRADQNSYDISSGQQILVTMQSGQQFVDWSNSFLEFDLELKGLGSAKSESSTASILGFFWAPPIQGSTLNTATTYELTGHGGSVLNLIERIVVTSRSGVELQRIEDFNKLHALHTTIKKSKLWKKTVGRSIQLPPYHYTSRQVNDTDKAHTLNTRNGEITVGAKSVHYSIPMECFMGLFDTKQLCPSMIASGLRIEFYLTGVEQALTVVEKAATSGLICPPGGAISDIPATAEFKIKNLQILTDTVTLNDAAMKQLNMTSAQNGLEYVYNGHFTQRYIANTSSVEIQCSKAVSRALFASAVHYLEPKAWIRFHMVGRPGNAVTWEKHQWRLGSQYFPHQPIETKSRDDYSKLFYNVLYATDTLNKNMQIDYQFQRDVLDISAPLPVVATFERSNLLRFSGVPINNSRTLSLSADITATSSGAATDKGTILLFLEYVMLSKAFLNNIVVSV